MSILTERELCEVLSVTRQTLVSLRKRGMPYFLLGTKLVRYDLQEVLDWLKENGRGCDSG